MTIQFTQAISNIGGASYSYGQTATLDPQTEYRLVSLNVAVWVGSPPSVPLLYGGGDVRFAKNPNTGAVTGIRGTDGSLLLSAELSASTVAIAPSGDATGATDTAAFNAAITTLYSTGGTIQFSAGMFYLNHVVISGGVNWLSGGYSGGILVRGISWTDTVIKIVGTVGFSIDAGASPGLKSSGSRYDFEDFKLVGPGKGTAGSIGFDYADQASHQNSLSWCRQNRVVVTGFETAIKAVDVTGLYCQNNWYYDNSTTLNSGYNTDIVRFFECQFGNNIIANGAEVDTTFKFTATSPYRTSAGANDDFLFDSCWFMHQAIILDATCSTGTINGLKFHGCYAEACKQYGVFGNGTYHPGNIEFNMTAFARCADTGETSAKFVCQGTNPNSDIRMINCTSDSVPPGGWFDVSSTFAGTILIDDSVLLHNSGSNQWVIKRGTKTIQLTPAGLTNGYRGMHKFAFGGNRPSVNYLSASGTSEASITEYSQNAVDNAIFRRWQCRSNSADSASGDPLDIINFSDGTNRQTLLSGLHRVYQGATLPPAVAGYRGCLFLKYNTGAADTLHMLNYDGVSAYAWKQITLA